MVGSFLNVVIYRVPRSLSIVAPRSFCPSCSSPIRASDNIPVVSWLALGGRCRNCGAPIMPRYVIIELLTGIGFAGIVARQLAGLQLSSMTPHHLAAAASTPALLAAILSGMICTIAILIDTSPSPDSDRRASGGTSGGGEHGGRAGRRGGPVEGQGDWVAEQDGSVPVSGDPEARSNVSLPVPDVPASIPLVALCIALSLTIAASASAATFAPLFQALAGAAAGAAAGKLATHSPGIAAGFAATGAGIGWLGWQSALVAMGTATALGLAALAIGRWGRASIAAGFATLGTGADGVAAEGPLPPPVTPVRSGAPRDPRALPPQSTFQMRLIARSASTAVLAGLAAGLAAASMIFAAPIR